MNTTKTRQPWTTDEMRQLVELWTKEPYEDVAVRVGHSVRSCRHMYPIAARMYGRGWRKVESAA